MFDLVFYFVFFYVVQMLVVCVDLEYLLDIFGKVIYVSEIRMIENDVVIYLFDEVNEEDSLKFLQFNVILKFQDYRCR